LKTSKNINLSLILNIFYNSLLPCSIVFLSRQKGSYDTCKTTHQAWYTMHCIYSSYIMYFERATEFWLDKAREKNVSCLSLIYKNIMLIIDLLLRHNNIFITIFTGLDRVDKPLLYSIEKDI